MRRYKAITPVTDFSVSQRIRVALIEDGHTSLAVESITEPIRDLEEAHALLQKRVKALESEKVEWMTRSGVFRAINEKAGKVAINWGTWALKGTISAAALLLAGWIGKRLHT